MLKTCFLQKHNKIWYSVAYYSWKITSPELNYNIYNKELLGIVIVLKKMESIFAKHQNAIYCKNKLQKSYKIVNN